MALSKANALDELYNYAERVTVAMDGRPYRAAEDLSYRGVIAASTPRGEDVPTLRVTMPDGFQVEFCPIHPLSVPGNALIVRAKRVFKGQSKNDYIFTWGLNGWTCSGVPVTDETIRSCLTPDGPPPATS
jgi:hypothetical protein